MTGAAVDEDAPYAGPWPADDVERWIALGLQHARLELAHDWPKRGCGVAGKVVPAIRNAAVDRKWATLNTWYGKMVWKVSEAGKLHLAGRADAAGMMPMDYARAIVAAPPLAADEPPPTGGAGGEAESAAGGAAAIASAFDGARPPPEDDPGAGADGVGGAAGSAGAHDDDDPCPVTPLGNNRGMFYFLSPSRQFREFRDRELQRLGVAGLFETRGAWLWNRFPRRSKEGELIGWNHGAAAEWLIARSAEAGIFQPSADLRGPGVWLDDAAHGSPEGRGHLVVHAGDAVWLPEREAYGEWRPPGRIGRRVYAASLPEPRPGPAAASVAETGELLTLLGTCQWRRPEIDARLLLGFIGASWMVGALDKRPSVWLSGDRSTGKTLLQLLIANLRGGERSILHLADTSEPGVRQNLGGAARLVTLDEIEAEEVNTRALQVVRLARIAYDRHGGAVARGSPGQVGSLMPVHAAFIFSSILRPPLSPQDLSRIVLLELGPLAAAPEEAQRVTDAVKRAGRLGPLLLRRMVDGWTRWHATLHAYQAALSAGGHGSRACDTLGTALAAADILLHDGPPDPLFAGEIASHLDARELARETDDQPDHERCLTHLLTKGVEVWRGGARTIVGGLVDMAAEDDIARSREGNDGLVQLGLRVVTEDGALWLAVSNTHAGVAEIFKGTHWQARSGATGTWVQALRRLDGARPSKGVVRFAGQPTRAVLIPAAVALGLAEAARPESGPESGGGEGGEA